MINPFMYMEYDPLGWYRHLLVGLILYYLLDKFLPTRTSLQVVCLIATYKEVYDWCMFAPSVQSFGDILTTVFVPYIIYKTCEM